MRVAVLLHLPLQLQSKLQHGLTALGWPGLLAFFISCVALLLCLR